jgi:hypothetical protein
MRVIIQMGLRCKAFDWIRRFLDMHPPERLSGTRFPEEFRQLNYAWYHYARGEYDEATVRLNFRPFENINYSIQAEVLLIEIYFETGNELLEFRLRALNQRIRRCSLPVQHKGVYMLFLKKLDKIIKYGWQKHSPKREKLIEEIRTAPNLYERTWLLQRLQ